LITDPLPPPQLYGIGVADGGATDLVRLYAIDLINAVATPIGTGHVALTGGAQYEMDFNPTVDRVRHLNENDENFRINPNNGSLAGDDPNVTPLGQRIAGLAYDRVDILTPPVDPAGSTVYAISSTGSSLGTLGSLNGQPMGANTGIFQNAKPLGLTLEATAPVGFDISPSGIAFAALVPAGGGQGLYTVDPGTGAATLVGSLAQTIGSLAIVPQSALPPVPVAPDTAPPTIALAGVKAKMSFDAFLKGVAVKVTPSEAASLSGELLGAAGKAKTGRLAAFTRVLAKGSLPLAAGQRKLKLKPKKKKVGRPAKAFKVRLRITATDAAGNAGTATRTIKVKPPKKKSG
jgi:hypothetical protein